MMKRSKTYMAIPPGYTLKEVLEDRNISVLEFAEDMGISEVEAKMLMDGDIPLTAEMALKMEAITSVDAWFWNRMEDAYRKDLELIASEA